MPRLEEITYDVGRSALGDQESVVAGVRQRTGTLLAAQALVASFLGSTAIKSSGVHLLEWLAIGMLGLALIVAAVILSPWKLKFALDAQEMYAATYDAAAEEAEDDTLGWLAEIGFTYQAIRDENLDRVTRMSLLSAVLGVLMVVQTLLWLASLGLD